MKADEAFLDWFAGFVAGEGSFTINEAQNSSGTWQTKLAIALRDDDIDILLQIQEYLEMGTVHRYDYKRASNTNPYALFQVAAISDCVRLVEIFSAHPLRARKEQDFEIWKEAVMEISRGRKRPESREASYNRDYLRYLEGKLRLVRSYSATVQDLGNFATGRPSARQLSFWKGPS